MSARIANQMAHAREMRRLWRLNPKLGFVVMRLLADVPAPNNLMMDVEYMSRRERVGVVPRFVDLEWYSRDHDNNPRCCDERQYVRAKIFLDESDCLTVSIRNHVFRSAHEFRLYVRLFVRRVLHRAH